MYKCPKCGSVMIRRRGQHGDFLGCIKYPKCTGTSSLSSKLARQPSVVAKHKPAMIYSKYQQRIFDFVASEHGNAFVEAVAGSGKTTTLVECLKLTKQLKTHIEPKVLFCAFNRHIKDSLRDKAPSYVHVKTLHGLGFGAISKHLNRKFDEPNENKVWDLMKKILPPDDRSYMPQLKQLVSLAKSTLLDIYDPTLIIDTMDKYGIDANGNEDKLIAWLPVVLEACYEDTSTIDYDDMIWLAIQYNVAMYKYDTIFVDEFQDLNASQIMLLSMALGGRIIGVGDRWQSIYGFRGADMNAIGSMIETYNATTLPLSICYRCPKSHVLHAKEIVPQIEYADWAEEGTISDMSLKDAIKTLKDKDLVLCRINAPLVKLCYSLIKNGHKAMMRGRDIGAGLIMFMEKLNANDVPDLMIKMEAYRSAEISRLSAINKLSRIDQINDKCDTLAAFCEGMSSIGSVQARIFSIFDDDSKSGVVCSSVHRAKGDEADDVYILNRELMPHPMAKQPWQQDQEQNLMYVSRTRAKKSLVYVI